MRQGNFSELLAGAGPAANPTGLSSPIAILDPGTGAPFAGNIIPAGRMNSAGLAYLKAFPEPNCSASVDSRCHSILQNYHNVRKRSEEHTSELQSLRHLVCRLLLEKKKTTNISILR